MGRSVLEGGKSFTKAQGGQAWAPKLTGERTDGDNGDRDERQCETTLDEWAEVLASVVLRAPPKGFGLHPAPFRYDLSSRSDPLSAMRVTARAEDRPGRDRQQPIVSAAYRPHLC